MNIMKIDLIFNAIDSTDKMPKNSFHVTTSTNDMLA